MKVEIRKVETPDEEQVILECVALTKDFRDIRDYVLTKGEQIAVYTDKTRMQMICLEQILYIEAVGELVFVYTPEGVFEVKSRLYELEERLVEKKFIRCSKSMILNLRKINSIRPALNGRFLAEMENKEEVMVSRQYAKNVKKCIMEGL